MDLCASSALRALCSNQFVEVSVHSHLAPRQGSMAERQGRRETAPTRVEKKQERSMEEEGDKPQ